MPEWWRYTSAHCAHDAVLLKNVWSAQHSLDSAYAGLMEAVSATSFILNWLEIEKRSDGMLYAATIYRSNGSQAHWTYAGKIHGIDRARWFIWNVRYGLINFIISHFHAVCVCVSFAEMAAYRIFFVSITCDVYNTQHKCFCSTYGDVGKPFDAHKYTLISEFHFLP